MAYLKDYLAFVSCYLLSDIEANISVENCLILKHGMKYFRMVGLHVEEMYFRMGERGTVST